MNLNFVIPGDINTLTGGYVYNKIIIEGLRSCGHKVIIHQLPGDFPFPSDNTFKKSVDIFSNIHHEEIIFIDSLAFGPLYQILADTATHNPIIPIIHLLLAENPNYKEELRYALANQEKIAFRYAWRIIAVSEFTKRLIKRYGVNPQKVEVIKPGVFESQKFINYPDFPENLLCIASYLPGKGIHILVQAMSNLKGYNWNLKIFGIQNFAPEYVNELKTQVLSAGLSSRIFINDKISGDELIKTYLSSHLFILPSYFENFSMAVNDALNFGIPVITTTAGGLTFSVPENMGVFVKPGNVPELELAIKEVITNKNLYHKLCIAASDYHKFANTWNDSIMQFNRLIATSYS